MKRSLLFVIVISILLTLCLSSCSEETEPLPDISDYNSEAFIPATSDSTADSSDIDPSDGFSVKDRKYTYENTGVVLLNVKNNTKKNYTVTIHGTYLDENGDVIGEETQTHEGFAAGWQNYVMFWPEFMFDKFTYKMEFQEYTGECIASKMDLQWVPGKVTKVIGNGSSRIPMISGHIQFTNGGEVPMKIYFHYIVFDSAGEIFNINGLPEQGMSGGIHNPREAIYPPQETHDKVIPFGIFEDNDSIEMPDRLKDGFSIIVAVTSANWDPSWSND